MTAERQASERQPSETAQAYQAFACFRDLGEDRTIVAAARALGKSESLLRRWAARWGWRFRAQAWDLENDREEQAETRRAKAESVKRRRQTGKHMQQLAMLGLSEIVRPDPETGKPTWVGKPKVRDIATLLRVGVELEEGPAPAAGESAAGGQADSFQRRLRLKSDQELQRMLDFIEQDISEQEDQTNGKA